MKASEICKGAAIAALYVVLTYVASLLGLSSGAIQIRFSEALCVFTLFWKSAVPGLTFGCLLANTLTGAHIFDIIFGSLATFIGVLGTYMLRGKPRIALWMPVISNTVIVPLVLKYAYGMGDAYYYLALTVGLGEIISIIVIGSALLAALKRYKSTLAKI